MSLYGDFKYPPDFTHFDYANPDAPKGGTMRLSSIGTFDTLNPFVIKGVPAAGIGQLFDTLMTRSEDEAATDYPLIAESADLAADRLSVLYTLNKKRAFTTARRSPRTMWCGASASCATRERRSIASITAT
jgi:microcin C transport system substrate-binding protein